MPLPVDMLRSANNLPFDKAAQVREREHVEAESIRVFMDSLPEGLGAGFVAVAIIAVWLHLMGVTRWIAVWAVTVSAVMTLCFVAYLRYCAKARTPDRLRIWGQRFVWLTTASGLAWGSAALFFLPGSPAVEMAIILGVSSVAVGGIGHMAPHLTCYLGFLFTSALPFVFSYALVGDTLHWGLSLGLFLTLVAAALFARRQNGAMRQAIALAYRNHLLAEALEVRTREAERANLAKSRFLTAASHDLRQPVHAIGLLLDVLRGQGLHRAQSETLDRLVRSFEALDSLFDGLLDVSRLDAGEVRPYVCAVSLDELLGTLSGAFEPLTRDKCIELRVRRSSACVNSDPVLLKRILWNLVANAVRYTQRGGVLVAARRRGDEVAIEVWDTGIGIAAEEQSAVFEEFYQCGNPERDRTKGLGLGLSIVRRLAGLLDHRVEMQSTPGRGSVFRVIVPADDGLAKPAAMSTRPASRPSALAGTRVIVIEDDMAVRDATVALLHQWGCNPTSFASASALREGLPAWDAAPDLILSDFRLPGDQDGLELIAWLREEFNREIPALLTTGDAAFGRDRASLPPGAVVLHKPVDMTILLGTLIALRSLSK